MTSSWYCVWCSAHYSGDKYCVSCGTGIYSIKESSWQLNYCCDIALE
ncbi:putative zinc ribbon protein [Escherichia coli]|nr:putative zinc ribbon protein [Escherichia coli]